MTTPNQVLENIERHRRGLRVLGEWAQADNDRLDALEESDDDTTEVLEDHANLIDTHSDLLSNHSRQLELFLVASRTFLTMHREQEARSDDLDARLTALEDWLGEVYPNFERGSQNGNSTGPHVHLEPDTEVAEYSESWENEGGKTCPPIVTFQDKTSNGEDVTITVIPKEMIGLQKEIKVNMEGVAEPTSIIEALQARFERA